MGGWLAIKALVSGILVAAVSEIARRYPGVGGLVASLPLVSVLGMIWLWTDRRETDAVAAYSTAAFWFVIPSLPMFLVIPALIRSGMQFYLALALGCLLTIILYAAMVALAPRLGIRL